MVDVMLLGIGTSSTPFGDGGPATSCTLNNPQKAVADTTGVVYVSDQC